MNNSTAITFRKSPPKSAPQSLITLAAKSSANCHSGDIQFAKFFEGGERSDRDRPPVAKNNGSAKEGS